jgi:transcription initiation factor TFIIB
MENLTNVSNQSVTENQFKEFPETKSREIETKSKKNNRVLEREPETKNDFLGTKCRKNKNSRKTFTEKQKTSKKSIKKYKLNEKNKIWEMFNEDLEKATTNTISEPLIQNMHQEQFDGIPERIVEEDQNNEFIESIIAESNDEFSEVGKEIPKPLPISSKLNVENIKNPLNEAQEGVICRICSSVLIITEDGFPTCTSSSCGIIYKDTLDYSPEWRYYGGDDKNANDTTRCGNPINPLLIESSFGCKIICGSRSSYEMKKMRKWTEWQSMPHKEKSLYEEFQFITTMAQNAGIPKIFIDDAMSIHKDISEQKMFRGLNRDGIKAASIYISCRLNGCPRTAHEISEIFFLDKISATAGCSTAVNILHNIERDLDPSLQTNLGLTTPSSFIDRYCSKLNMSKESTILAKFVVLKVEKNNIITDNTPHAIAAGVVFFVAKNCNININKLDIKKVCGISEVTVNKCFKKLEAVKTQLLPNCVLSKGTNGFS